MTQPNKIEDIQPAKVEKTGLNADKFYTMWEPKAPRRFIVYASDEKGDVILPVYVIKGINRPSIQKTWWRFKTYSPLKLRVYDPIVPSASELITHHINKRGKWNFEIHILGPVGDLIEKWVVRNAKLTSTDFGNMNWTPDGSDSHLEIGLNFAISDVTLYNMVVPQGHEPCTYAG